MNFAYRKEMKLKFTVIFFIYNYNFYLFKRIWKLIFYFKVVDLKEGNIKNVSEKEKIKTDCTIMIKDEDFIQLSSGKAKPQQV